ncbi:ntpase (nacht family) [Leptolyngbya sp. Heron Island J]|uniref:metallophosphoesterase n=1 Tax=Leptolyngbya sp. Heron Island J TaxID=1385935 RepID=UPI0003B97246|nr:metallophosphoesterase [Leptolyngbya sp. Heron Island J]ESA36637.1 ntpase (nacht family) [Leptolyngbya sp. Heron Island J]
MVNILHLSDLHFGTQDDAKRWYTQIATDLRQDLKCDKLNALIISGDIANRSSPEEYEAARKFIVDLVISFRLKWPEVICVPGNHDLNWNLAKDAYRVVRRTDYQGALDEGHVIDYGEFVEVLDPEQYKQRFSCFSCFYDNIVNRLYPLEPERQYTLNYFPKQDLLVLGLNSAWQLDHHYTTRAGINTNALANALIEIDENSTYQDSRLKIAVWHHPLNSPDEDRIKDHGFMQQLAKHGFRLALHGHIHQAMAQYYQHRAGSQIDVIAAGTFGAPVREWVPGYPLQYNLLRWEDNRLTVYTRKRPEPNGAWQPDAMWVQADGITALSYHEIELWEAEITWNKEQYSQHEELTKVDLSKSSQRIEASQAPVKTVLFLAANPKGTLRLRLDEEVREIDAGLRRAQKRDQFHLEQRWAVRSRDIQRAMLDVAPQIIHFSGHGAGEEGLVLENERGKVHFVDGKALASLFKLFADSLECIVLNGCYSEVQAKAIAQHIDCVIGMKQAIGDNAAIEFAVAFYDAMGAGRSIEFAYEFGCAAIQMTNLSNSLIPVLYKGS